MYDLTGRVFKMALRWFLSREVKVTVGKQMSCLERDVDALEMVRTLNSAIHRDLVASNISESIRVARRAWAFLHASRKRSNTSHHSDTCWFQTMMLFVPREIRSPALDHVLEDRQAMATNGRSRWLIECITVSQCLWLVLLVAGASYGTCSIPSRVGRGSAEASRTWWWSGGERSGKRSLSDPRFAPTSGARGCVYTSTPPRPTTYAP